MENENQNQYVWNTLGTALGTAAINSYFNKQNIKEQNEFNAAEAEKQRQFEKEMSNTAYQRAYEDMRKAGLNPNLAGGQGGASTPSGSAATSAGTAQFDLAGAINANANAATIRAQIENMNADTTLKGKQSGKTEEEMKSAQIDNQYKDELNKLNIITQQISNKKIKAETEKTFQEIHKMEKELRKMDEEIAILKAQGKIKEAEMKTITRNRRAYAILEMAESATRSVGNLVGAGAKAAAIGRSTIAM